MSDFSPFANDTQSLTLTSGNDELSVENGTEAVLLFGTLTLKKSDNEAADALRALIEVLQRTLTAMS